MSGHPLEKEREHVMKFSEVLENYLKSDDFKSGVISATKASWGGSGYSVELFESGSWHNLWNNEIGNLYESSANAGMILCLPTLETDDMTEYVDGGAGTQEEFLDGQFDLECEELVQGMRDILSDKHAMYGEKYA
jgi:hypothetical protein